MSGSKVVERNATDIRCPPKLFPNKIFDENQAAWRKSARIMVLCINFLTRLCIYSITLSLGFMCRVYCSLVQTFEKKKGRVSLRWMGDVEMDLRNISVKRQRIRGLDKSELVCVVREVKVKLKC
jgi:hypothetical protein